METSKVQRREQKEEWRDRLGKEQGWMEHISGQWEMGGLGGWS